MPLRPIFLTLETFRHIFLKIKQRGQPVRIMPRHKLEVIKLLIIAIESVKTVILNALEPSQNFSRKGSRYNTAIYNRLISITFHLN